jgi:hypothetical protein
VPHFERFLAGYHCHKHQSTVSLSTSLQRSKVDRSALALSTHLGLLVQAKWLPGQCIRPRLVFPNGMDVPQVHKPIYFVPNPPDVKRQKCNPIPCILTIISTGMCQRLEIILKTSRQISRTNVHIARCVDNLGKKRCDCFAFNIPKNQKYLKILTHAPPVQLTLIEFVPPRLNPFILVLFPEIKRLSVCML